jgi:hypothetical protein
MISLQAYMRFERDCGRCKERTLVLVFVKVRNKIQVQDTGQ